jgi:16S rRNA (cytosine1402-N4)-methyltransferase
MARVAKPQDRAHRPVMLAEVLEVLAPRDGAIYVDGTFGAGGYSEALLQAADCRVWGIDRDPRAMACGSAMAARFPGRLRVIEGRFGEMDRLLAAENAIPVDGVALDLGVSSPQLDEPERGFSFRFDGPLDMRMSGQGPSAADVVNSLSESDLADIIYRYGEERRSRAVARAIVAARAQQPITRTLQLAEIVRGAVRGGGQDLDPATRTFQALRIYVNDELGELGRGLAALPELLVPGGRLVVVSFHSLEDRLVKRFLAERGDRQARPSRHLPDLPARQPAMFRHLYRGAIRPRSAEIAANPRARSARLRAAERLAAPAREETP